MSIELLRQMESLARLADAYRSDSAQSGAARLMRVLPLTATVQRLELFPKRPDQSLVLADAERFPAGEATVNSVLQAPHPT